MTDRVKNNMLVILTIASLLLGILASTGGWMVKIGQTDERLRAAVIKSDDACTRARDNQQSIAVMQAEIRGGFAAIEKQLSKIENKIDP